VWAFQTVHHNLWDYDVAAEPLLFTFHGTTPAIAISTKAGMVFVLDRRTGVPLYPVEERQVPKSDVPGETAWPTQPISSLPSFAPGVLPDVTPGAWTRSAENAQYCRDRVVSLRYEGLYTPPSLRGTLQFPGPLGGVNWGSTALDPATGILYANNNRYPFVVRLVPRASADPTHMTGKQRIAERLHGVWMRVLWLHIPGVWFGAAGVLLLVGVSRRRQRGVAIVLIVVAVGMTATGVVLRKHYEAVLTQSIGATFGHEEGPEKGAPYMSVREPLVDHDGMPCTNPPFGALTAINLNSGEKVFERPLGTSVAGFETGGISLGGPMVTAGGLVFTAATKEKYLRAFDATTGAELWKGDLPVPAQSTPMSYSVGGRQFIVIAAGGHGTFGTPQGDSLIAFGLD
jgi:quinoprotein glucose dehydrogenase